MVRKNRNDDLFLPQLMEKEPGPWTIEETVLDQASVNKRDRIAQVPPPYTEAQRLGRKHEGMHIKVSPADFGIVRERILRRAVRNGLDLDSKSLGVLLTMLEENRVDWLLWSKKGIDVRPARETLDWSKMSVPDDHNDPVHVLEAVQWVLQLAWTVWASHGFPKGKVPDPPPVRETDPETENYFNACWSVVQRHNPELAKAIIQGCLLMYNESTPRMRDRAAYELAKFFPVPPPPSQPEEKEEEKQQQQEALDIIQMLLEAQKQDEEGGVDNEAVQYGHYEVHDHTRGPRRPQTKIRRKFQAMDVGSLLKYPQRYLLDRMVFGRRMQTDGALMIDFSGSMNWTNDDMLLCLHRMPQIWIGSYSGVTLASHSTSIIGRICVHAAKGRFNVFTGQETVNNGGNQIDLEALYWLARQPEPRFWLSDGMVNGGKLQGLHADLPELDGMDLQGTELGIQTALVKEVNAIMKRANILRAPDKDTLMKLMLGRRVTLYRTTYMTYHSQFFWWSGDNHLPLSPISFQL